MMNGLKEKQTDADTVKEYEKEKQRETERE